MKTTTTTTTTMMMMMMMMMMMVMKTNGFFFLFVMDASDYKSSIKFVGKMTGIIYSQANCTRSIDFSRAFVCIYLLDVPRVNKGENRAWHEKYENHGKEKRGG